MGERSRDVEAGDTLCCFYDLSCSPVTFDFLNFLVISECYRIHKKLENLQVVICGHDFRAHTAKDKALSREEKIWRVKRILEPACWLLPSCVGVSVCFDRKALDRHFDAVPKATVFPEDYRPEAPTFRFSLAEVVTLHRMGFDVQVLEAPDDARRRVQQWAKAAKIERRIVTLLPRYSPYIASKNAKLKVWEEFDRLVWDRGYQPVLVPDTYLALNGISPYSSGVNRVFYQGSLDLEMRMGMFDESVVTVSKQIGPALYNLLRRGGRSVVFLEEASPSHAAEFFRLTGVRWGEQLPWSNGEQRLVFQDETVEGLSAVLDEAPEPSAGA